MKLLKGLVLLMLAASIQSSHAQTKDTTLRLVFSEYKVHDQEMFKRNFLLGKEFSKKNTLYKEWVRNSYTSESGRIYGMLIFKGVQEFAKYMEHRGAATQAWREAYPKEAAEGMANNATPLVRTFWRLRDSVSYTEPGYTADKYPFRKIVMFSVAQGKSAEYEALARQMMEAEAALGVKYNSIVYQCTDGYPNNYYLRLLPDDSRGAYYTHLDARDKAREGNAKLAELRNKINALVTIVRIDHMNVVR